MGSHPGTPGRGQIWAKPRPPRPSRRRRLGGGSRGASLSAAPWWPRLGAAQRCRRRSGAERSGRGRGAGMTELRQRLGREPGGTRELEEKVGMRVGERRGRGRGAGPAAGWVAARPADGGGSGGGTGRDGTGPGPTDGTLRLRFLSPGPPLPPPSCPAPCASACALAAPARPLAWLICLPPPRANPFDSPKTGPEGAKPGPGASFCPWLDNRVPDPAF